MGSTKISTIDLEEPVVEALNTIDTVADQITDMNTDVDSIKNTVESNATGIANIGTKLDTINTNTANINTRLTDTRASNLDLLADGTNGLAALKTAINSVNTAVSNSGGNKLYRYHASTVLQTPTCYNSKVSVSISGIRTANAYYYLITPFIPEADGFLSFKITVSAVEAGSSGTSYTHAGYINTVSLSPECVYDTTGDFAAICSATYGKSLTIDNIPSKGTYHRSTSFTAAGSCIHTVPVFAGFPVVVYAQAYATAAYSSHSGTASITTSKVQILGTLS